MDQPRGHRPKVGRHVPSTMAEETNEYVGCGGTADPRLRRGCPPSLELLDVATAMPSKPRDPRFARVPLWGRGTRGPVRSTGGGPPPFPITLLAVSP